MCINMKKYVMEEKYQIIKGMYQWSILETKKYFIYIKNKNN